MASPFSLYLTLLILLSTTHFSSPIRLPNSDNPNRPPNTITDVHDILPKYGLPKGLLPDNVQSYSLSNDGSFEIELESTCYVKFDRLVYYEKTIKGKLSYGKVSDVSGIQAKKAFFWVSLSGIVAHLDKGTIEFQVGFLSEELPIHLFDVVHSCKKNDFQQQQLTAVTAINKPVQSI